MIELRGLSVSTGLAAGRVHRLQADELSAPPVAGTVDEENVRFGEAIGLGRQQLKSLACRLDEEAAAIIEFQSELLSDPVFLQPAFQSIADGETALKSWKALIEREVSHYRLGGKEQFSARADDLFDLGERIVRCIHVKRSSGVSPRAGLEEIILIADVLAPSRFLELNFENLKGIATAGGSPNSHVSILAKARGMPMIVGCGRAIDNLREDELVLLDADAGVLRHRVKSGDVKQFAKEMEKRRQSASSAMMRRRMAKTPRGGKVRLLLNLDHPDVLDSIDPGLFDGVGLFRTEFLFSDGAFPGEDEQYRVYRRVLEWAGGCPVTIRVLDAGGDKPIDGITLSAEHNPFLGIRGIRLLKHRREIFLTQMRALARAAVHGDLRVMVPMVSVPNELEEFHDAMREVVGHLTMTGVPCRIPPLGMMVEVPSAALCAVDFDVHFYSIGTNDLIQYTLAAARDEHRLSYLLRGDNPAVLALIAGVASAGSIRGREVGVCGDMASDPGMVGHLLNAGIRNLSVAPTALAAVRESIARWLEDNPDE